MKDSTQPEPGEGGRLLSGIAVIVLAGVVLGIGYNVIQSEANPSRALAWVRKDVPLKSLESLQDSLQADAPAEPASWQTEAAEPAPSRTAAASRPTVEAKPGAKTPAEAKSSAPASAPGTKPAGGPSIKGLPTGEVKAAEPPKKAQADLPVIPDTVDPLDVKLGTVKRFYDAGAAIIVDAREPSEFAEGHIAGAVNLSFDEAARDPSLVKKFAAMAGAKPAIVYCGGGDCELSRNLGSMLIEAGHKKVLVFTGGYPEWTGAGYPTAKGGAH